MQPPAITSSSKNEVLPAVVSHNARATPGGGGRGTEAGAEDEDGDGDDDDDDDDKRPWVSEV